MRKWKVRRLVSYSLVPLVCVLVLFWDRMANSLKYPLIVGWVALAYYALRRGFGNGFEPDDPIKQDEQATAELLKRLEKDVKGSVKTIDTQRPFK